MAIDLDAILAQREEATGSAETFTFTFNGKQWSAKDPVTADDEWKDELAELEGDIEVSRHIMGDDQYDKFVADGGRSGYVMLAYREHMKAMQSETDDGRPTRRSNSSTKRRKS